MWVFTEGELTEPQYVDLVKDMQPVRRNEVHIFKDTRRDGGRRGSGDGRGDRKPRELVEAAIAWLADLKRQAGGVSDEFAPVVWCIFDRDQHEGVDQAISRARLEAKKRALQINEQHDDHTPLSRRDPYTDVWQFVEDLGIVSY
ncbi:RloB family protein [Micromonospora echinofusca]|uniref:RloB family protein n=1 Tax=Micromonospora echinofusca TaxID=47858 RepID=UPI0012FE53B7|nr:RloB family protein [Micromonospora echinofusca]